MYLRGRALLVKRGRHLVEGIECLKRAVISNPKFAAAWAGLADSHTVLNYWGYMTPGEAMPKALTAARRAVVLDPDLGEAHAALAMVMLLWERDYPAALAAFERALTLNANYVQGRGWSGAFYLSWLCGRTAEGVGEIRRALDADPLSAYTMALLSMCLFSDGQLEESLEMGRRAAERDPDSLLTQWAHQMAAQLNGLEDEMAAAKQRAESVSGGHPYPIAHAVWRLHDFGRMSQARVEYARLLEIASRRYVPCTALGLAAASVGEADKAIELAHQAVDKRDGAMPIMVRTLPEFQTCARRSAVCGGRSEAEAAVRPLRPAGVR